MVTSTCHSKYLYFHVIILIVEKRQDRIIVKKIKNSIWQQ